MRLLLPSCPYLVHNSLNLLQDRIVAPCTDVLSGSLTSLPITRSAEAIAVLDALRENKWPKLEDLNVNTGWFPEDFNIRIAKALEGGAGSNLGRLEVLCDSVESVREVGRVLCGGACPKLRSLYVCLEQKGGDDSWEGEEVCLKELKTRLSGRGIVLDYSSTENESDEDD